MHTTLGQRLKMARMKMGLTQDELARRTGVAQQTITKIEKALVERPRRLKEISQALECSEEWLMFGMKPPKWIADTDMQVEYAMVPTQLRVCGGYSHGGKKEHNIGFADALSLDPDAYGIRLDKPTEIVIAQIGSILMIEPNKNIASNDLVLWTSKELESRWHLAIITQLTDVEIIFKSIDDGDTHLLERDRMAFCHLVTSVHRPNCFHPN